MRVLFTDNHSLISDSICALLKSWDSIEVIGLATVGDDISDTIRTKMPDVILIDIDVLPMDIDEFIRVTREANGNIRVVIISTHEDWECILRGLRAGSNGYLLKKSTSSELFAAIKAVYQGGFFLDPSISNTFVSEYLRVKRGVNLDPYNQLSEKDRNLFKLLAEGYKCRQIAEIMNLSQRDVSRRKSNFMAKLGIHNQTELVKYAINKHLIEL